MEEYHIYKTNTCCVCNQKTKDVIVEKVGEITLCEKCKITSEESGNILCLFYQSHYSGDVATRHTFVYGAIFPTFVVESQLYGESDGELKNRHKIGLECLDPDEILDEMKDKMQLYFPVDSWDEYPCEETLRDWETGNEDDYG